MLMKLTLESLLKGETHLYTTYVNNSHVRKWILNNSANKGKFIGKDVKWKKDSQD
jgi:hypothetical protein